MQKVKILKEMGNVEGSIELLRESALVINPQTEPRLYAYARQSLLTSLNLADRHHEAEQLLPEIRVLFRDLAEPLNELRVHWMGGNIAQGLGRHGEAEAVYREVQQEFLELGKSYDWALVSLDLAALLLEQGQWEELKRLSAQLVAVFESKEVYREASAALLLFRQACEEERVTLELIRQVASQLSRERRSNGEGL